MPTISYKCKRCEIEYDVFYLSQSKRTLEEPKEKCPKCESTRKVQLPSKGTSFELKGGGWAKDRYSK
jgi:putative FmdB family regulatory protein